MRNEDIFYEIERRLSQWRERGAFKAVHICPKNSSEVPDEQKARLVILPPKFAYVDGQKINAATETAKEILESRGTLPRKWRNMLLFMAAESEKLRVLKNITRDFLAWQSVNVEARYLNLDSLQLEDAKSNLESATKSFVMKTSQAYSKIFVPALSEDGNLNVRFEVAEIDCKDEKNILAASEKFIRDENLVEALGCRKLEELLDKFIWRESNSVGLKKLWEYFSTYYYLPRLTEEKVLLEAVSKGVAEKVFGVAEDFRDGEYLEPKFGDIACKNISAKNFLLKVQVAQELLKIKDDDSPPDTVKPDKNDDDKNLSSDKIEPPPLPKNFSMSAELDKTRYKREIKRYVEEIVSHLMMLEDASIRVEIKISVPAGIPTDTEDMVTANCRDLKVENFQFQS